MLNILKTAKGVLNSIKKLSEDMEKKQIENEKQEILKTLQTMDPNDEFYDIYQHLLKTYEKNVQSSKKQLKLYDDPNVMGL